VTARTTRALVALQAIVLCAGGCSAQHARYGLDREPVRAVSRRSMLRWEPFEIPPAWTADPAASPGEILRVTYELRVFGAHGDLHFDDLTATELLVPVPYEEIGLQLWTVRPRVETTHGVRLGPWSQFAIDEVAGRSPQAPPSARALSGLYAEW